MNREDEYYKKYGEQLIGKAGDYVCGRCKEIWEPTDADINRKAMMTYYKCCGGCRAYLANREVARRANN